MNKKEKYIAAIREYVINRTALAICLIFIDAVRPRL